MDCLIEDRRWAEVDLETLAIRAADVTLDHLGLQGDRFDISLLGCTDRRIADLNADFRGKPQPTNVLSWPSEERGAAQDGVPPTFPNPGPGDVIELGDIAIAYETCAHEAEEAARSLPDHTLHLLVHGVLHLLGYDHERDRDATLMEALETAILGKLGVADPYS